MNQVLLKMSFRRTPATQGSQATRPENEHWDVGSELGLSTKDVLLESHDNASTTYRYSHRRPAFADVGAAAELGAGVGICSSLIGGLTTAIFGFGAIPGIALGAIIGLGLFVYESLPSTQEGELKGTLVTDGDSTRFEFDDPRKAESIDAIMDCSEMVFPTAAQERIARKLETELPRSVSLDDHVEKPVYQGDPRKCEQWWDGYFDA